MSVKGIGWPEPDPLLVLLLQPGSHRPFCSNPASKEVMGPGCLLLSPVLCWYNLFV